ncbi:MAG: DUF87 domain-containing protein [Longimicrobiales bacterium]|nr:DUF87 domain-containing protein [Longimicrobiales bacterium]
MTRKPGSLHLGQKLDPETGDRIDERLDLSDHRLTTHGIIVGMTGSGKTGLGIVLLEEVLAAGTPALILDPKGDMGNLLLNFPEFRGEDFEPWVDEGEARRKGVSASQLAAAEASKWRQGLAASGIDADRMRGLRSGTDIRIITPGATSGIPLNMVGDLHPPDASFDEHAETIRDEIEGLVSGLLVMTGIEADPLTSREHILLSNLVEHAWKKGRPLDLSSLILQVQRPPLRKLGVFELDAFYPEKDRMKLAMRLNGLMASPSFAEWITGEPLDIDALLDAPDGRTRASIIHLAHLSDAERMFVVTVLLTKFVTWMRKLPGTSELKALVYADEVMGFAPPTAEPPTKRPILTLYKQARAHGVGLVMATQNPVDLDYKLMSNAGTWMVGRLQTERDKARIIEGLRSASGDVDVSAWDARIGELGKREFLLKSAASATPELFTTRWAMSYLRGPLTRAELLRLKPVDRGSDAADTAAPGRTGGVRAELAADETSVMPEVAAGVEVRYLDPGAPWAREMGTGTTSGRLEAGLAARISMLFDERVGEVRHREEWEAVVFPLDASFDAAAAVAVDFDERDFTARPPPDARYALPEAPIERSSFFTNAERALEERLFRNERLELRRNRELKLYSRPGESEDEFRRRCFAAAEDEADADAEKLRDRYERKLDSARKRLENAERRVRELDVDVSQRKQQELVAGAGQLLSMFLGGRRGTSGLSSMASRRSRTRRTEERLRSALEKAEDHQRDIADLEEELTRDIEEIWNRWREKAEQIETFPVHLERTDVTLDRMVLFWAPVD